ncbi:MAG: hypothetical protein PHO34_02540 [Candidatus Omnitrophica bacterium]|nr:hypothetical protein [Candidatus Omnitrophota bacterium]MDD5500702.1 hypothetical protein [Candidatus Omnitrophota bacterium]
MKRIIIALAIVLFSSAPLYAVNTFDRIVYKEVVLRANHTVVLVNRLTQKVKYLKLNNGRWEPLTGGLKNRYQSMYDRQISSR